MGFGLLCSSGSLSCPVPFKSTIAFSKCYILNLQEVNQDCKTLKKNVLKFSDGDKNWWSPVKQQISEWSLAWKSILPNAL